MVKIPAIATLPSLTARKGRDGMEYPNKNNQTMMPLAPMEEKTVSRLNDYAEITIGGVVYRVKSVFSDKEQMGASRPGGDRKNQPNRVKGLCFRA